MFLSHFFGQKIKIEMVFNELHIFENVKTKVEVGKNAKFGLIILVKNQESQLKKCLSEKTRLKEDF